MNTSENTPSHENKTHGHPHAAHETHAHAGGTEHSQHAHTDTTAKTAPARAWMIGGFVVAVLLLVGFLIFTKFQPTDDTPLVKPVEIKLLVDSSCEFCPQTNTILAKLDESKIKYSLETFDIYSTEGKALASEFEINYAPTALVNIAGLDQNSTIQAALQGQFIKNPLKMKKGWIIVPEIFLDKQPKLLTFIKAPETCTVPEGKIVIDAQLDYGDCKPCIDAHLTLERLKSKFAQLTVDYDPIMYGRSTLKALSTALQTNKGAVCAEKLGYLDEYTACNYFNAQFHGSLDINFMKACALDAGMSKNTIDAEFVPCIKSVNDANVNQAEQTLINNTLTMHKWNPLMYTPSFVIDCTYAFVGQNSLEKYLCMTHPELEGCTQVLEDARNPPVVIVPDTNATLPADGNVNVDDNAAAAI